jgi:tetratricopeptide (TPR) repeat protein
MATVSGNFSIVLTTAVLFTGVLSGCNAVMQARPPAIDMGDRAAASTDGLVAVIIPDAEAYLPRQGYNAAGVKVPYVLQPNPYTADEANVPAEARSIFVVAGGLLKRGDLEGAGAKYRTLAEKYPSLSGPWVKLGEIAEKQSNYTQAISHYEKAVSVNSSNVNAYIALGLAQRKLGKFAAAQRTYLDALKLWKDFPEAHLNLAILYDLYINKPEAAQKHYEAYCFLVGEKDEKVRKWLVEVKRRTGIESSFIDNPPPKAATVTASGADAAVAIASTGEPEQN